MCSGSALRWRHLFLSVPCVLGPAFAGLFFRRVTFALKQQPSAIVSYLSGTYHGGNIPSPEQNFYHDQTGFTPLASTLPITTCTLGLSGCDAAAGRADVSGWSSAFRVVAFGRCQCASGGGGESACPRTG